MQPLEYTRGRFTISTDKARLQVALIHDYLTNQSYWAQRVPLAIVQKSIEHSLCFGVYDDQQQIGFCRVITDFATFAYLADVFILEAYQGQGLGKWLIETVVAHPELQTLRRWLLATQDAHSLYAQYGFGPLGDPSRFMTRHRPNVYVEIENSENSDNTDKKSDAV